MSLATWCRSSLALCLLGCAGGNGPVASEPSPTPPPPIGTQAAAPTPSATALALLPDAASELPPAPPVGELAEIDDECRIGRKLGKGLLDTLIRSPACRVNDSKKWIEPYDASAFTIRADPSSLTVQRGAHADLMVQIAAQRDAVLQLDVSCMDSAVETSVHDAKGNRIDESNQAGEVLCAREVLHVQLSAGDEVGLRVPFIARKIRWGNDMSRSDDGPLPAGTFELRLTLPIAVGPKSDRTVLKVPLMVTR